jgi:cyclomaltodextrinase
VRPAQVLLHRMKTPRLRRLFALLLPMLWLSGAAPAQSSDANKLQSFIGWIPMQPVTAGERLVLDMNRFYFRALQSEERLVLPDKVEGLTGLAFDANSRNLILAVAKDASGLIEVPLRVTALAKDERAGLGRKDTAVKVSTEDEQDRVIREAVLLIAVQPADGYTFTYRPPMGQEVGQVHAAGSFNGWSTRSHELKPAAGGVYEVFVPLSAGVHPYKLMVDGEWILDPANPEKQDDGTGNENSVARVGASDRGARPAVFAAESAAGLSTFRLVRGGSDIVQVSAVLQLPDGTSRLIEHQREGDLITVEVPDAPVGTWVRVVVADAKGNVSNAARVPVRKLDAFQWQDGIIYYAFTDRFANGNADNDRPVDDERVLAPANYQGGDFEGIRKKIDEGYFRDLGVNILWLAPINRNPDGAWRRYLKPSSHYTGYHGFWPVSHTEVEPRFGGERALTDMISAAHGNGMFIIADLVLKHVHTDHPLVQELPGLFGSLELPDGSKNSGQWGDRQFTTRIEEWLPAFDFGNPDAVQFLIANAVDLATRFNLDGYRLDAVQHIERGFWWKYRTAMRVAVEPRRRVPLYSLGETVMDREGIMSFVGPNMLDGQFDLPLYETIIDVFARESSGLEELERSLSASELIYGKETLMSPLLGHHDKARFMAYADGDLPHPEESDEEAVGWKFPPKVDNAQAYRKLKLGLTFILSVDGVPMIYYGDEIGKSGAGDPDNRRMMRWGEEVTAEENAVREHFSKVAAVRHKHQALRYGSRRPLVAEGARYAFVRAHLGDAVLAVWNRGDTVTEFTLGAGPEMTDGTYVDALSGQEIVIKNGRTSFKMEPMKSALFVAKEG